MREKQRRVKRAPCSGPRKRGPTDGIFSIELTCIAFLTSLCFQNRGKLMIWPKSRKAPWTRPPAAANPEPRNTTAPDPRTREPQKPRPATAGAQTHRPPRRRTTAQPRSVRRSAYLAALIPVNVSRITASAASKASRAVRSPAIARSILS